MKSVNVLLTGATGFNGSYLLSELLQQPGINKVFVLCRRLESHEDRSRLVAAFERFCIVSDSDIYSSEKISMVAGDINIPRFGVSDQAYKTLCEEVDVTQVRVA